VRSVLAAKLILREEEVSSLSAWEDFENDEEEGRYQMLARTASRSRSLCYGGVDGVVYEAVEDAESFLALAFLEDGDFVILEALDEFCEAFGLLVDAGGRFSGCFLGRG